MWGLKKKKIEIENLGNFL